MARQKNSYYRTHNSREIILQGCIPWLVNLNGTTSQVELSKVLGEREALERLPDAGLNRLDSLRWEQRRLDKTVECRRCVKTNERSDAYYSYDM